MTFTSMRFRDTRTGEIVTQVPISEFSHFDEYDGPLQAGDFSCVAADKKLKQPDWLDDHLIIVGLPEETTEAIKDRLRKDLQ